MPAERTLYVGNLPFDCEEDDLKTLLEERIGELESLLFPRNNNGRPAGHAYAALVHAADMEKALDPAAPPLELDGRALRISQFSQSRRERLKRDRIKPKEMKRIAAAARAKRKEREQRFGNRGNRGGRGGRGRGRGRGRGH